MRGALRAWWLGLARRERAMSAGAAAATLLALLYAVAIEPAWTARARLGAELPRLRAQAAELDGLAREAKQLRARGVAAESATAAKGGIEKSLAGAQLGAARVAAIDERRVAVSVKGAPAGLWLAWMEETARESRLRISVVQVSRSSLTPARGLVDADVTFEIGGRP